MKRIILAMFLAGSASATYAQQPPLPADMQQEMPSYKNWLVYGDLGYNNQNNDNTSNSTKGTFTNWALNAGLGYRLNDQYTVGLQGGMAYSKTTVTYYGGTPYAYSYDNRTDNWSIGAFFRHNLYNREKFFYGYGQLNLSYVNLDAYPNGYYTGSIYSNYSSDQINNGYGFQVMWSPTLGINLPFSYQLNFNFGGIGYTSITQDHGNGTSSNFNITFAQQIKIGVSKVFNFRSMHAARAYREPGEDLHRRNMEKMEGDEEEGGMRKEGNRKAHDMDDE